MSDMYAPGHRTAVLDALRARMNAALRGKPDVVERALACVLARGHLLIEDRPGLGKTTLAKALADALGGTFGRVQCTPDLLPSDVTGFNLFSEKTREFEFRPGPVFADIVLADEINRATPRTQSALLEAMAERQVTYDGVRRALSPRFFVIATQNPAGQHGTYPLPEAQCDRFAMKLTVGYPSPAEEAGLLAAAVGERLDTPPPEPPVTDAAGLAALQTATAAVAVTPPVRDYLLRLATATRTHPRIELGVSPRGLLTLQRVAQAWALLSERDFVSPDDVQDVAPAVLGVRLGVDADDPAPLIAELLDSTPVPDGRD
ncbi:ATPase family associated with various cellular activities (AAA) [Alienimonas californiensis]|uniref:ATPase family associated with various cellular activities (AAA) n=2 Tax=Alienimonas californiensis TaxID=2527989 RepID=A0A517P6M8_9PLAN|nr:ATPase family associated with various cellular activities (AAA) [Alienimonas californiensis]